ncbi:hypothetical protein EW146_g2255 [Bondarzewia mesenterica]|uniref:GmrSD restriction endonucleases N-terminal domain-containing protein n=1 Tax=Bondarzewia mesenterica TaxID=1095465 RepID=A0A4S4M2N2_9AGAM|nr:hypothetical protein EW146_g2255 [Bondarzewia mesenterica]
MSEKDFEDRDELMDEDIEVDEDDHTFDPNVFKIRQSLEQPFAQAFTTAELHAQIHEGIIDLNPPYQRDVVWGTSKQMEIIDSILHNYYVPPVIFTVRKDEDGEETRVCVDGKQRLTSIQKFFDGQIGYRDPHTKKLWWYTCPESSKSSRNEMPIEGKKMFADKYITCVEYSNLTPEAERDVFQRVQLGVALTAAEKLQAISSPWAAWINGLESRYVSSEDGLTDVIKFDTKRGRNFQNLAHLIYCCDGLPDQFVPTQTKIEKWMYRNDQPPQEFQEAINEVLSKLWHLASQKLTNQAFQKITAQVAPVEFVYFGVLLYVMRDNEYTDEDRAECLYALRKELRESEKDIRLNTRLGRRCWEFINKVDGGAPTSATGTVFTIAALKDRRKRRADEDAADDYRPTGSAKKNKAKVW